MPINPDQRVRTARYIIEAMQQEGLTWADALAVTAIIQAAVGHYCGVQPATLIDDVTDRLRALAQQPGTNG